METRGVSFRVNWLIKWVVGFHLVHFADIYIHKLQIYTYRGLGLALRIKSQMPQEDSDERDEGVAVTWRSCQGAHSWEALIFEPQADDANEDRRFWQYSYCPIQWWVSFTHIHCFIDDNTVLSSWVDRNVGRFTAGAPNAFYAHGTRWVTDQYSSWIQH